MKYKLGTNIKVGDKILLKNEYGLYTGWKKVEIIKEDGVEISDGFIAFGSEIYGWEIK